MLPCRTMLEVCLVLIFAGDDADEEAGAFDVSTIKGKLAKRAAAGAKRGKKVVEEKKKKDEAKKPKQKVHPTLFHRLKSILGMELWDDHW